MNDRTMDSIAVAPMMDWTDRHCRYFMRLLSPSVRLYTEMITANAIHFGDAESLLAFHPAEHPIAVQLGGSDPELMAEAALRAEQAGYDEININVGCPSDRVQSGQFGACLMDRPDIVARCVERMRGAVRVPVTVKTRIGIDDRDDDAFLDRFVDAVADAGCTRFIVHARIAILEGLSPKENRTVPPLRYGRVFRLKERRPDLEIVLNGGLASCGRIDEVLASVDGAMIGRHAYQQPYFLSELERHFDPRAAVPTRRDAVTAMIPYIERELAAGERLGRITRHMTGLFAGRPGARAWRRHLSEHAFRDGAGVGVVADALDAVPVAA